MDIEAAKSMASLFNRSGTYYATFSDHSRTPKQRRHSLKTRSKRMADRLLAKLDEAYTIGNWDPWTGTPADALYPNRVSAPKTVSDAVALYLAQAERTLGSGTYRTRHRIIERFANAVGKNRSIQRLTSGDIEAFVSSGGVAASTQRTRLVGIKALFSYLSRERIVTSSPAHAAQNPKPLPQLPKAVSDAELAALLSAIPERRAWTKPVFEFAALTGLRVSELARLQWSDFDMPNRLIRIEQQKNGKAETQPIPEAAVQLLSTLPDDGRYVFGSPRERLDPRSVASFINLLNTAFREARIEAGIQRGITPHGLRHRYCTKLAEAGVNAYTIAAAARHGSVKTSQRYVSISNQVLRAELDAVFSSTSEASSPFQIGSDQSHRV